MNPDIASNKPYLNTELSLEERVNDLVSKMSLVEKISQMSHDAPAIPGLDIPKYNWWNECLHGVARSGYATVFPQAITLANSWDTDLILKIATVISDEARIKYNISQSKGQQGYYQGLTFWSPNINIYRDPRWGRGQETYGEDPYLTGELGYYFVLGLQGDDPKYYKLIATPKHFAVHSGPEPERHRFDVNVSQKDLLETYLPAFRRTIVDGKAFSIMCAYNRFRGKPCCGSDELLIETLRNKWKFEGYLVSDCWAIEDFWERHKVVETAEEAVSIAVKMGTDLSCGNCYPRLLDAVKKGIITEDEITISVKRLFTARFRLGMFDPPENIPFNSIPASKLNSEEHNSIALEAARKAIVLLKNRNSILPLKKDIKKIAVIGPNGNDIDVLLGNYNGFPVNPVTVLQGIKNKLPEAEITYSQGCNLAGNLRQFEIIPFENFKTDSGENGLHAEYFNNPDLEGNPVFTRTDKSINFFWDDGIIGINSEGYSVRWSGYLIPDKTGKYNIGIRPFNKHDVYIDDALLFSEKNDHEATIVSKEIEFESGNAYKIKYEFRHTLNYGIAELLWAPPNENMFEEALENAKNSDIILLALGLSPRLEGEEMPVSIEGFAGGDRTSIDMPETQLTLLEKMCSLGKPVILITLNGGTLNLEKANEIAHAILLAGYPGQQGGNAIADVLFGDYNPAGRLPVTYYKSVNQIPLFDDYNMIGRTYRYFTDEPLYPFGFGLSYTKFAYTSLKIDEANPKTGDEIYLNVKVKNSGEIAGDEVVQLYIRHLNAKGPSPIHSLKGFKRISLAKDEEKIVEFVLNQRDLAIVENSSIEIIPGQIEINIGGRQPGYYSLTEPIPEILTARINLTGKIIKLEK